MSETRKLAAILAADVVGYSRLAGADEERTLVRLRALRGDLIDPAIAAHRGRLVKTTGDGVLVEFRSVVDAVRCAVEIQNGMAERNAGVQKDRKIEFRIGVHLGDVVEEADGDLMGDGVNIAARLEGIAQPGTICLSEDAYRQVRSRIDLDIADLGEQRLKNIAHPVRAYSIGVGLRAPARPLVPTKRRKLAPILAGILALILALIVVAIGAWFFFATPKPIAPFASAPATATAPAHLSIVVLPFVNLSGNPDQQYFADGITENLITDLSRIRNSFVIARNTAFTYMGKTIDSKQIGKDLGVRYALEGSVQRDGRRVRVNVQLVDTATATELWADRFEDDLADLFKLQDQIVARLANSLGYELVKAEAEKSAHSKNPDAIDLTMRGLVLLSQPPEKEVAAAARHWFEQALALDPNDADALAGNAMTYLFDYAYGWGEAGTDYDAKILGEADRAIVLAPDNVRAYAAKSFYLYISKRGTESLAAANAGLAINPNDAALYAARRGAELALGRYAEAKADMQQAMRLSPRDPRMGTWHMYMGDAELGPGNYDAAIAEYQKAIEGGYRTFTPYADMAAAYALAGKMDEARSALAEARRINPSLTLTWEMAHAPTIPKLLEGLRKAGLPENDAQQKLSIVVLPFQNLSGDAKQDYLADVLTDELTTYISRIPGSFVIARNTAFTYKNKPVDVKQIGKDLGVRYALEGSVQPTDKRIRTNAQLIDTETGAHLWAEDFDTDKTDLLQTEDEIVTRLARSLDVELTEVEAAKGARLRPDNPDAQDLALRCLANFNANVVVYDPRKLESLDESCESALKLDPKNPIALRVLAIRHAQKVYRGTSSNPQEDTRRADELIQAAIAIDPNDSETYAAKASVLFAEGRMEEAAVEAQRAIELNPSDMYAYGALCASELGAVRAKAAIDCVDRAMRLSPRDPLTYLFLDYGAWAFSLLGKYDEAITWYRRALPLAPNSVQTLMGLAGVLAHQGQLWEAHELYERAISVPGTTIKTIGQFRTYLARLYPSNAAAVVSHRESVEDDMRKAGMPEK